MVGYFRFTNESHTIVRSFYIEFERKYLYIFDYNMYVVAYVLSTKFSFYLQSGIICMGG